MFNFILKAYAKIQYQSFLKDLESPHAAQARVWKQIRKSLQASTYWKTAGFSETLSSFPLSEYETYAATLKDSQEATHSPLNGERLLFWARTSGTSGEAKFFPMTQGYRTQFQRVVGPMLHALFQKYPKVFVKYN